MGISAARRCYFAVVSSRGARRRGGGPDVVQHDAARLLAGHALDGLDRDLLLFSRVGNEAGSQGVPGQAADDARGGYAPAYDARNVGAIGSVRRQAAAQVERPNDRFVRTDDIEPAQVRQQGQISARLGGSRGA